MSDGPVIKPWGGGFLPNGVMQTLKHSSGVKFGALKHTLGLLHAEELQLLLSHLGGLQLRPLNF